MGRSGFLAFALASAALRTAPTPSQPPGELRAILFSSFDKVRGLIERLYSAGADVELGYDRPPCSCVPTPEVGAQSTSGPSALPSSVYMKLL